MLNVLLRKLLLLIPGFIGITMLSYTFLRMVPGGGPLTEPGLVGDYLAYLQRLLHGDLGISAASGAPVLEEFLGLFPATLELSVLALLIALLLGLPAGMVAAVRHRTTTDYALTGLALVGYSMPIFWWGLLLVGFFSLTLGWTPVAGRLSFLFDIEPVTGFMLVDTLLSHEPYAREAFFDALLHLLLPALVLSTIPLALFTLITRSAMLEVLSADYIRAARSYGLSRFRIVALHAFRNALIPVVTVLGLQVSVFFTGAMLTETIFSWPGVGKWLLESVSRRDYMAVQGGVLVVAILALVLNTAFDILFAWVNPRVRR